MTAPLANIAPTLGKLIRLLGTDRDGERLAAAHAIDRVLKTAGHDWHDLADALAPPLQPQALQIDWRREARFCADREWLSSARELDFIGKVSRYRNPPSQKQMQWLHRVYQRLAREAA